jgi:type I restriction enzyme S subunit
MKQGWPTKRLGDLFAFKNGRAFKKEEWTTNGLPIIRIQNLNNEDASFNYFAGEYSQDILVEPGDLLFSWSGTVGSSFGSHLWNGEPGVLNQHIFKIGLRETIAKRYAFHGLRYITAEIEQSVNGAVGLVHITKEKLNEFTLPVPPLAEQQRIVGLLDEAFEGIATAKANAEKNLQNARALFESHLQSVFTQRGPRWVVTTLDKISTNLDSKRVPITKNVRSSGEYPYYGASGIVDYVAEYIFDGDTLLVSEDGANLLARSTPIAFSVSGKYWVNNHAHILKFENMATQRFVEFYLESIKLDEYITGAAQPKLNQKALNSIPIPIPKSVETQAKIVESVESLQEETQRLARLYEQKLAALEALKKSLLHQAFTGLL